MSAPIIAFFNNKGGVGKTSLVYHLAWMYADMGVNVLAADLDPQANLTAAFLPEEVMENIFTGALKTVYDCVEPLVKRKGDVLAPDPYFVNNRLALLTGDLRLSGFEDLLATGWAECRGGQEGGYVVTSSFWRIVHQAAEAAHSDLILLDLGPNLGAINRAALLASDHLVVPLGADLFSLQGIRNLGPTVREWKNQWARNCETDKPQDCPSAAVNPLGYVVQQHSVRLDRPVKSYEKWMAKIPGEFRRSLLGDEQDNGLSISLADDPWCLALLKHYHSLMPMAQEARKPMFHLKFADGAIGSHLEAAASAGRDFKRLALTIQAKAGLQGKVNNHPLPV